MVTDIRDYRKHSQLKGLNTLVKELLEVRQHLKYFEELNLPDYQNMIDGIPEEVDIKLLNNLNKRQKKEYAIFFDLKERESRLREKIQRASDELDKIL